MVVTTLNSICYFVTDRTKAIDKNNYISTENILQNRRGIEVSKSIPKSINVIQYCAGDVLVSNIRPYLKKIWYAIMDGGCSNDVSVFRSLPEVDNLFLYHILAQDSFFNYANDTAIGIKMPRIDKKTVLEFALILPPLPEQRRIAAALSDTDALIAALEKLITKKHAVKQGAMQELLTGKRRLPGFSGEFININLVANSTLKARIGWQGLTAAEYLDSGYSYLVTGTDFINGKIAWSTCHYVDKHRYDQDKNIQVVNGDVLITKDGTIGKVSIVSELNRKATLNSGVFVLRSKARAYDHKYVYYVLLSQIFMEFLDKLAAGSTITHLYQKDFANFKFDIPPTLAEQTAIAEILSDMDMEIDKLTAKLNKLKNIKQGIMSELLTGKIRLIEEDTTNGEN